MPGKLAFASRTVAIFVACCAPLASGCGSSDGGLGIGGNPASAEAGGPDGGNDAPTVTTDAAGGSAPDVANIEPDAGHPVDAGHAGDAGHVAEAGPANPCPVLTFPSGVQIQTYENAAMTASYANHLGTGEKAPKCFLDTDNLLDPSTGTVNPITVDVAAHFTLDELVGTEVSQGYGHLVLMEPAAVASLEKFRDALNTPVSVNSGFRSPKHQEDVCNGLCGMPLGCPGTCANNSRHMFGDAFDLPLQFYTMADEQLACTEGFKFAYLESGTHLHIDQNPAYATCVIQ